MNGNCENKSKNTDEGHSDNGNALNYELPSTSYLFIHLMGSRVKCVRALSFSHDDDGHCVLAYVNPAVCSNRVEIVREEEILTNVPYLRLISLRRVSRSMSVLYPSTFYHFVPSFL